MATIITRAGPVPASSIATRKEGGEVSTGGGVVRRDVRGMGRRSRGFDFGSPGTSTRAAFASSVSGNAVLAPSLWRMRAACRDLIRNNPHAKSAVRILTSALVSYGITPSFPSSNSRTQDSMDKAWKAWVPKSDVRGVHDFYGQMRVAAWQFFEVGEVFIRLHVVPPAEAAELGLSVPLQLEMVESEQVTMDSWQEEGGAYVVNGIKHDAKGKRLGAYVYVKGDGDPTDVTHRDRTFVPFFDGRRGELLHIFDPMRGQDRGEPYLAVIGTRLEALDVYSRSLLARAQVEACFAGFVKRDPKKTDANDNDFIDPALGELNGGGSGMAGDAPSFETIQPGMMHYLEEGEDVVFSSPQTSGGLVEFARETLRAIAAGMGVPYELLTGDLSNVNYASFRAGTMQFREQIETLQYIVMIPQFCAPIVGLWMFLGYLTGKWNPADSNGVTWNPPRMSSVDPVKDATATLIELKSGMTTFDKMKGSRGEDWREDLGRIAEVAKVAASLGIEGFMPEGFGAALARAEAATAESEQQEAKDAGIPSGKPQGVTRAPRVPRS